MRVDLVLDNANVITIDPRRPRAGSVAVLGERIVVVDEAGALGHVDAAVRIDLAGATVAPGFDDAHNHMQAFGATLGQVRLSSPPVSSVNDIVDAVARRAAEVPAGT